MVYSVCSLHSQVLYISYYVMLWHCAPFCIVFVYRVYIMDSIIFGVVEHWTAIAGIAVYGSLYNAHVVHDNDYHV